MISARSFRHAGPRASGLAQRGSYLLEALIAILIVAIGVLGVVGLYVRSMQNVDDAKFRGEAALLVNTLVGQMWISDTHFASLQAKFDSGGGGAEYTEFAAMVAQRMPNSVPPTVVVAAGTNGHQHRRPGDHPVDTSGRQRPASAGAAQVPPVPSQRNDRIELTMDLPASVRARHAARASWKRWSAS